LGKAWGGLARVRVARLALTLIFTLTLTLALTSGQWSGTHLGPYHMVDDSGLYTDLPASGQLHV